MDALVIVDFQNDFTPGGALAVPDAAAIAEPLARLLDRFELVVAGLATDYCVRRTGLDALAAGFDVVVIVDAIRGVEVEPGDSARAVDEMRAAGAVLETATEVAWDRSPSS